MENGFTLASKDGYKLTNLNLIIPSSIDGQEVKYITTYDYNSNIFTDELVSIKIPNTVIAIRGSFGSKLTSIQIPVSVASISFGCWNAGVTVYYEGTEEQWNAIDFHDSNSSNSNPVRECTIIYNCGDGNIKESATETSEKAYFEFTTDDTNNTASITKCASSLIGSIDIPSTYVKDGKVYSVTTIGDSAFLQCASLTSITIPDSVTTIKDDAFKACTSLTSITIPDSVTTIGDGAFYACDALTSITIPDSVTSIGTHAFYACDALTSITIPDSVTTIGDYAFRLCTALTTVYYEGTEEQWNAISIGSGNNKLTSATIIYNCGYAEYAQEIVNNATQEELEQMLVEGWNYWNDYYSWGEPTYNNIEELMEYWKENYGGDYTDVDGLCEYYGYTDEEGKPDFIALLIDWQYVKPEGYFGE